MSAGLLERSTHLDDAEIKAFAHRRAWLQNARHPDRAGKQLPPADKLWEILLFIAGRGFGKTAGQVEWAWWEAWRVPGIIVHAVGPTRNDVRGTTMEGPAGFLNTIPAECLQGGSIEKAYNRQYHEIRLANGSLIRGFGAVEEAGRLRGPQCHALICDELREWDRPAGNLKFALNNALFGLRLRYPDGTPSRAVMGTTPKPIPYLKQFEKDPRVTVVRGTSYENLRNLSQSYRSQLFSLAGTALGRQEIDAAYIDEESDLSILKRNWVRLWPFNHDHPDPKYRVHKPLPTFSFIVTSYDTASSEDDFDVKAHETDPTACITLGVFNVHEAFNEFERKRLKLRNKYGCILLRAWSERLGLPALLEKARKENAIKYGPFERARKADMTLIEDKSSGPGVRQFMREWGLNVFACSPRVSKTMRMHTISPLVAQGMLWVPESKLSERRGQPIGFADAFMDEVTAYAGPGSTEHDDYVDCLSQAFNYLRERGMLEATPEVEYMDAEERIDAERKKAEKIYRHEQRRKNANPYG